MADTLPTSGSVAHKQVCREAANNPKYKDTIVERTSKLALQIHEDACSAAKYRVELVELADLVVVSIATYYYNYDEGKGPPNTPYISENLKLVLESIQVSTKEYHSSRKFAIFSRFLKRFRVTGREAIQDHRTRLMNEIDFQVGWLKKPIPSNVLNPDDDSQSPHPPTRLGPASSTHIAPNEQGQSQVAQGPPRPRISTQSTPEPVVPSLSPLLLSPSHSSKVQSRHQSPSVNGSVSEEYLRSPDLYSGTSAFSSPAPETSPDTTPDESVPRRPIRRRYLEGEEDIIKNAYNDLPFVKTVPGRKEASGSRRKSHSRGTPPTTPGSSEERSPDKVESTNSLRAPLLELMRSETENPSRPLNITNSGNRENNTKRITHIY